MSSSAAFSVATATLAWIMRFILVRANRKLRQSNDEVTLFYAY